MKEPPLLFLFLLRLSFFRLKDYQLIHTCLLYLNLHFLKIIKSIAINLNSMKYSIEDIKKFVLPYYEHKDIMHDFTHIQRIEVALKKLTEQSNLTFRHELTKIALYFHGIIYSHEPMIKTFLREKKFQEEEINLILKIAWESQKEHKPTTTEGLMLHDAHMLEGGRNFEIIKSLITGSVRGQTLEETMQYIEKHLLEKGKCYTAVGIKEYEMMKKRTKEIYEELNIGLGRMKPEKSTK